MADEKLKILLERNLALTEETHDMVKKIKKYILVSQVLGVIKIVLIIAPLVLAFIYLPSHIQTWIGKYKEMLPVGVNIDEDTMNVLNQYLQKLPKINQ